MFHLIGIVKLSALSKNLVIFTFYPCDSLILYPTKSAFAILIPIY